MSTISHESLHAEPERSRGATRFGTREMWGGLAIVSMWIAVLFAAVFAPDIVTWSNDGNHASIPSVVAVALFASLASAAVAKYAFRRRDGD